MGRWATTCNECTTRYTWKGSSFPVPPCPKCQPKKGNTADGQGKRTLNAADDDARKADVDEALEQCERIIEMTEDVPDPGIDFAIGTRETTEGIQDTIERTQRVTKNQQEALDNMESALGNWLRR